ncbi:unnamed protein product, partial [Mesocestoides corti]
WVSLPILIFNLGLNESDVETQRQKYGANVIPQKPPKSIFQLVWEALQDLTLLVLIAAALTSLGLSLYIKFNSGLSYDGSSENETGWIEGVAILVAVVVVVVVVAFNDWQKERQFRGLQSRIEAEQKFTVLRSGRIKEISISDIVVGDVCLIKYGKRSTNTNFGPDKRRRRKRLFNLTVVGDLLPADGILLQSSDLRIDESSLTGESDHVNKSCHSDPILLSGKSSASRRPNCTHVMEGSGRMLVTAVGKNSQAGIIYSLLNNMHGELPETATGLNPVDNTTNKLETIVEKMSEDDLKAPSTAYAPTSKRSKTKLRTRQMSVLQLKLAKLAIQIGYIGRPAHFCVIEFAEKQESWETGRHLKQLIQFFIIGVTILVVAVPEGLPLAVTLSLAYSVKEMMKASRPILDESAAKMSRLIEKGRNDKYLHKDNNLVRHLDACETMGNATTICSDKTGTLTTNRMTVIEAHFANAVITLDKLEQLKDAGHLRLVSGVVLRKLELAIAINSSYTSRLLPPKVPGDMPVQAGNKTECALLGLLQRLGRDYEELRNCHPESQFVKVYSFSSTRKSMSTIIKSPDNDDEEATDEERGGTRRTTTKLLLLTKGAAELIISKCTSQITAEGKVIPLNEKARTALFESAVEPMARKGLRTIALAYRELITARSRTLNFDNEDLWLRDLVFVCVVGIEDPVRPEVPLAIAKCQRAGITVRMVTGDNLETARSIALKCGILTDQSRLSEGVVMDGRMFNRLIRHRVTGQVSQELVDKVGSPTSTTV